MGAVQAKKEYEVAMEQFKAAGGVQAPRKRKADKQGGKPHKDPNKPKKPTGGAYGQFMNANRVSIMNSLPAGANKITDTARKAGEQWKMLSEKEKEKYEKLYQTKMEEYNEAMANYSAGAEDDNEDDDGDDDA